jgi:hypothetical protein
MPRAPKRRVAFVLVSALLLCAGPALADPPRTEIATARRLFTEAEALREAGRWADAAAKLREALALKETPGLRFHLAHCEAELGHLVAALAEYDRARELIRAGVRAPDVEALLEPARAAVRALTPTLAVRVAPDLRDVHVTLDGREVPAGELAGSLPLDPGAHSLAVEATDRERWTLELRLAEGEARVLEPTLSPSSPPPPALRASVGRVPAAVRREDERAPAHRGGLGVRAAVLTGESMLTVAGVVFGIAYLVQDGSLATRVARDQAQIDADFPAYRAGHDACSSVTPGPPACADLAAALDDRARDRTFVLIGFASAGVGAASLVATWLAWPAEGAAHGLHARLQPTPGGAVLRGTF